MNLKKLLLSFIAVFITIFATDFLIHGVLMKSLYEETSHLWRAQEEMGGFMPFMILGQATIALFFSWIFIHGYKGTGCLEGVRYGLFIAGLQTGTNLVMYSVSPYTTQLIVSWIGFGAVQAVLAGIVATVVVDKVK